MQSKYSCRFLARAASLLSALGGAYPFTRFTALQFLTWSEWNIILLLKKCFKSEAGKHYGEQNYNILCFAGSGSSTIEARYKPVRGARQWA
jgi:hypothetical protein